MAEISSFDLDLSSIVAAGETRSFSIAGDSGAAFRLEIRNEDSYYYNFITKLFQVAKSSLDKTISSTTYEGSISFPAVTDDDHYDVHLSAKAGTTHAPYNEARFGDGSIDINSTTGSNSLLMSKVIYQYTALTLTLNPFSVTGAITSTVVNDTISISAGEGVDTQSFSMTVTVANDKALQIIKQPAHSDVISFVMPTLGSVPVAIPGENIYPTVTGTDTVNGELDGATKLVMDANVATKMSVGDRVAGTGISSGSVVTVVELNPDGDNVKEFSVSEAVTISDGVTLSFSNQMNYRWSVDNFVHIIKPGFIVSPGAGSIAGTTIARYSDTTTVFPGTDQEKTYINNEVKAVDTLSLKPAITRGEISTQAGAIVFNQQQPLALGGTTQKIGGYGQGAILSTYGYDVVFSDLAIALTPVTTVTTAASSASTSVVVASRNGILDSVSTVSGIGINPKLVDPTVASGAGAVSGAGTIVLSSTQTIEDGATLTFANASTVATITGNIQILKAGTASQTLRFDIEKLLSIT